MGHTRPPDKRYAPFTLFDAAPRTTQSYKQAAEAFTLAEAHETNPVHLGLRQGLTRLNQRTPWQDGLYVLDRAASRLLATVH